jgi:hypothetical protein
VYFNIILQLMIESSWLSLSFWLSHQNPICIPLFSQWCYMPCHLILLDLITVIILGKD